MCDGAGGPYQMFGSLVDVVLITATSPEGKTILAPDSIGTASPTQQCTHGNHSSPNTSSLLRSECCSEGDCSMHGRYFSEVPADFADELVVQHMLRARYSNPSRSGEKTIEGSTITYLSVALEYGRNFSGDGKDVFDPVHTDQGDNIDHPDGPGVHSKFLHPVLRVHRVAVPCPETMPGADVIERYLDEELQTRGYCLRETPMVL